MSTNRNSLASKETISPRKEAEIIDEAIDESFPASDPPAHTPVISSGPPESRHDPEVPVNRGSADAGKKSDRRRKP